MRRMVVTEGAAGTGERGEARVGGVRIVHESWGDGPVLVCCHAFGVDRNVWAPQIAHFARTHRLVTFDQRGSGESDHPLPAPGEPDPYTVDTFAEDLLGVLDAVGCRRARILGYSMGGATALRFAARWPERVEALVLVSTMASRLPEAIIERAGVVERVLQRDGVAAAYRLYFEGPLFERVPREKRTLDLLEAWMARATPHGFRGCFKVTIDRPSMVGDLGRILAPTLILVGERDTLYRADAEMMAHKIPNSRAVVMPGLGHAMNVEAPDAFADEITRFLESLPENPPE